MAWRLKGHRLRVVSALLCLAVFGSGWGVATDQPTPPRPAAQQDTDPDRSGAPTPEDEFIEFLGTDDVGDAAWWEFLRKSAPPREDPGRARDVNP